MQVETLASENLKRHLRITIPADDFSEIVNNKAKVIARDIRLPGFRPGKVPANHIKKVHGVTLVREALSEAMNDYVKKVFEEQEIKPAYTPEPNFEKEIDPKDLLSEPSDIVFDLEFEVMPDIAFEISENIKLDRPVCSVSEDEVDTAVNLFVARYRDYKERDKKETSAIGDEVTFDSTAVNLATGEEFAPLTASDQSLILQDNESKDVNAITQISDALVNVKKGGSKKIVVDNPDGDEENAEDSSVSEDAKAKSQSKKEDDKEADETTKKTKTRKKSKKTGIEISLKVKKVSAPQEVDINELAKRMGLEGEIKLRSEIRDQLTKESGNRSNERLQRRLLDKLNDDVDFQLPERMVERELAEINRMVEQMKKQGRKDPLSEGEAKKLADRRVRLGLLLLHVGREEKVEPSEEDLETTVLREAEQHQIPVQQLKDYFANNPQSYEGRIRMPTFEAKVVQHIVDKISVNDVTVTRDELNKDDPSPFADFE